MADDGSQPGDALARPPRKSGVLAAIGAVEHPDVVVESKATNQSDAGESPVDDLPELKPLPDLPLPVESPEAVARFEPVPPPGQSPDQPESVPVQPSVLDPEAYLAAMEQAAMERAVLSRLSVDPPSPKPATDATRRHVRLIAIAGALVALIGVAVVLIWVRPACCGDGQTLLPSTVETGAAGIGTGPSIGGPSPRPSRTAKPAASRAAPGAVPSAKPSPGASPTPVALASSAAPPPAAAPLRASYRTTASGLLGALGYRGEITLTNPNGTAATDWTVVVELRGNNEVVAADGAAYLQLDNTVTFIPADTGNVVPANGSTTFSFDVRGVLTGAPRSCTVNGSPCAG